MAGPVPKLIARAREKARARVRRDMGRLERRLADGDPGRQLEPILAILDHVLDHLPDPLLNVAHIERGVQVDGRVRRRFREETGLGIHEYLIGLKCAMAEWLLAETELPVSVIAEEAFDYSSAANFHRDFKRWKGATPLDFRKAARAAREADPDPEVSSIARRFRASVGLLPPEEMRRFAEDLERRFRPADDEDAPPPPGLIFRGDVHGETQAEIVWNRLQDEPPERQLEILRRECAFESEALLDFLSRKSLEASRRNRREGVHWARGALASVEGSRRFLGKRFGEALALARTRLGNALRLAGELEAANLALAEAREVLSEAERPNPRVLWEVSFVEALVRLHQRRFEEALGRVDEAVELCREHGGAGELARCLLARFDVRCRQGHWDRAVQDLRAAEELVSELDEPCLSLGVRQNRVALYAQAGDYENAARELSRARELCEALDHRIVRNQLHWLDGRIRRGLGDLESAETIWREALAEFKEVGEVSAVADLTPELALLCQDQDRLAAGLELVASETIPALRALGVHREGQSALDLLQEARQRESCPAPACSKLASASGVRDQALACSALFRRDRKPLQPCSWADAPCPLPLGRSVESTWRAPFRPRVGAASMAADFGLQAEATTARSELIAPCDPPRESAARPTLERIENARPRVSPKVAEVLDDVLDHLFVPEFDARELARAFKSRDQAGNLWKTFAAELGRPVASYVLQARVETAARLLRESDLEVARISTLVGFDDVKVFRMAFWRFLDAWPQEFRQAARRAEERAGRPPLEVLSLELWERLDEGRLEPEEGRRLVAWFRALGSTQETNVELFVEGIWRVLEPLPPAVQHHLLQHELLCDSPALFELLSCKSLEASRRDRRAGVWLAKLALASVKGSERLLGERFHPLHGLARARLGNALRLAMDFSAAHGAFQRAREALTKSRQRTSPRVAWELLCLEAALLLDQRRSEAAHRLVSDAMSHISFGDDCMLARTLLIRFEVEHDLGLLDEAEQDLRSAEKCLRRLNEPQHLLGTRQNLVALYVRRGEYRKAAKALPRAEQLCEELGHRVIRHQLQLLQGQIHQGQGDPASAERVWKEALSGFDEIGDLNAVAELGLELALLYHQEGRFDEVLDLVTDRVIPALEALGIYREHLAALELLQEAVAAKELSRSVFGPR